MTFTPQDFVRKWKRVTAREKQTYQEHFIDLCHLVGHQTPNDYDPTRTHFGFEIGAARTMTWTRPTSNFCGIAKRSRIRPYGHKTSIHSNQTFGTRSRGVSQSVSC